MTNKKENILKVALELFAHNGYNATSTSRIAKQAGVSEGLIFRHFNNKKGLLEALIKDAEERINQLFGPIIFEMDPKAVLRALINLPYQIPEEEYDYWKLQFQLKWESEYNNPNKVQPILDKLTWAFTELAYEDPGNEALMFNQIIESISMRVLRDGLPLQASFKAFLISKYKL